MLSCVPVSHKSAGAEFSKQKGVYSSADCTVAEWDLSLFGFSAEKVSRKCFCWSIEVGDQGTERNLTGQTQEDTLHLGSYSNPWSLLIIFWEKWDIGFEKKKQEFYANPVCNICRPSSAPSFICTFSSLLLSNHPEEGFIFHPIATLPRRNKAFYFK